MCYPRATTTILERICGVFKVNTNCSCFFIDFTTTFKEVMILPSIYSDERKQEIGQNTNFSLCFKNYSFASKMQQARKKCPLMYNQMMYCILKPSIVSSKPRAKTTCH